MVVFGDRGTDGLEHTRLDFAELSIEECPGSGAVSATGKLPC
jgi:hypothetical protein